MLDYPDGTLGDYLGSLDRLEALGPATVLPAHGPVLTCSRKASCSTTPVMPALLTCASLASAAVLSLNVPRCTA